MNKLLTFTPLLPMQESLIVDWLKKPHVNEWYHGEGLQNTIKGIKVFLSTEPNRFDAWVGYCDGVPISFLMTFTLTEEDMKDPECHQAKWMEVGKKMIGLDLLIGEEKYLGQGLATPLITEFISQIHPDKDIIFIDPETSNSKAIHVYEKAGFKKIDDFIASWHPVPHILMMLKKEGKKNDSDKN